MKKIKKTSKKKPASGKKTAKKAARPERGRRVKPTKRLVKKLIASISKSKAKKSVKLGKVIHYYNHIKVGIVKLSSPLLSGQKVQFKGATTDFSQAASSIQINHVAVKKAKKGQVIGLKVSKRVRQGDEVFVA